MATMPLFAIATLGGCIGSQHNSTPKSVEPEESKPLEVGDTVRMWTSPEDYEKAPLGLAEGSGTVTISEDDGYDDYFSLSIQETRLRRSAAERAMAAARAGQPTLGGPLP